MTSSHHSDSSQDNLWGSSIQQWQDFYHQQFQEHQQTVAATETALFEGFYTLSRLCVEALKQGNKIIFFGNGGSAADAQHLATELTVRFIKDRPAIAALALTTDTSCITAIGNDFGFTHLFSRQLEALGRPGDVVIAISTSGKSPNIVKGLQAANRLQMITAALGGKDGGDLMSCADHVLIVPSYTTSRIQEMHITLGQMLCGAIEKALGYAD